MESTTTNAKKTNTNDAAKKNKGGNDGKSPRALRGSPKAASNWSAADEARFQEQLKEREAFVAERTASLTQITALLFAGAQTNGVSEVKDAEGNVLAEAKVFPSAVTQEQLLANLSENGDAILTYLSKHFKLQPLLIKKH